MSDKKPEFTEWEEMWLPHVYSTASPGKIEEFSLNRALYFVERMMDSDKLALLEAIMQCLNSSEATANRGGMLSDSVVVPRSILEETARVLAEIMPQTIKVPTGRQSGPRTKQYSKDRQHWDRWNAVVVRRGDRNYPTQEMFEEAAETAEMWDPDYDEDNMDRLPGYSAENFRKSYDLVESIVKKGEIDQILRGISYEFIEPQPGKRPIKLKFNKKT